MTAISAIASHVPAAFLSNRDRMAEFDLEEGFLTGKIGVERVSRLEPGQDTADLCLKAWEALRARTGIEAAQVDCIVVCTQNPQGHGIPHTSAVVHGAIGAPESCAAFDISLGCSGWVYALSVVGGFMDSAGLRRGLLFTADPYSKIVDPQDRNTVLLFGDAATVTLLDASGASGCWIPRAFRFGTRGTAGDALTNRSGRLVMNGRAVFEFSATAVPAQVRALLGAEGLTMDDVDLFLFHQGSRYIVDTLARRLALAPEKVPCNLGAQGNTVSSSIPLLFEDRLDDPSLRRIVASGFGVGLSWASAILERAS
jgi:3-oxoacyl-[acyl-carrier-protein] synthase-3